MSLADKLGAPTNGSAPSRCSYRAARQKLSPADQADLDAAVKDLRWSMPKLSAALRANGIVIADNALYAHRRGGCKVCSE